MWRLAEKSTVIGPPGGRFNSTPGTYLNSTLGFAYMCHEGERSGKFVTKSMIGGAAQATGPGLAAILVKCLGDEWTVTEMKVTLALVLRTARVI